MTRFNCSVLVCLVTMAMLTGCGSSGTAKIQLNKTSLAAPARIQGDVRSVMTSFPSEGTAITPTTFQMKFMQAYLSEDIDANQNNVGKVQRIWVNPDCADPNTCSDADVGFFDLIDPTAANAKLNSQNASIDTGTYRYVKIDFCVGSAKAPNVKYQAPGGAITEKTYGGCGVTSAKIDPPVTLQKGDTITIRLDYDLTKGPLYSMPGSDTCTSTTPCLGGIELVPAIVQ